MPTPTRPPNPSPTRDSIRILTQPIPNPPPNPSPTRHSIPLQPATQSLSNPPLNPHTEPRQSWSWCSGKEPSNAFCRARAEHSQSAPHRGPKMGYHRFSFPASRSTTERSCFHRTVRTGLVRASQSHPSQKYSNPQTQPSQAKLPQIPPIPVLSSSQGDHQPSCPPQHLPYLPIHPLRPPRRRPNPHPARAPTSTAPTPSTPPDPALPKAKHAPP